MRHKATEQRGGRPNEHLVMNHGRAIEELRAYISHWAGRNAVYPYGDVCYFRASWMNHRLKAYLESAGIIREVGRRQVLIKKGIRTGISPAVYHEVNMSVLGDNP